MRQTKTVGTVHLFSRLTKADTAWPKSAVPASSSSFMVSIILERATELNSWSCGGINLACVPFPVCQHRKRTQDEDEKQEFGMVQMTNNLILHTHVQ